MPTAVKELGELTDRQRKIWEMSHGIGEFDGKPMSAQEIATALGITTNSVYVTRRRVKLLLGMDDATPGRLPKRIIRQESGLSLAVRSLQEQRDAYSEEEESLRARLEQIEREKPEVESALTQLRSVIESAEKREPVAA